MKIQMLYDIVDVLSDHCGIKNNVLSVFFDDQEMEIILGDDVIKYFDSDNKLSHITTFGPNNTKVVEWYNGLSLVQRTEYYEWDNFLGAEYEECVDGVYYNVEEKYTDNGSMRKIYSIKRIEMVKEFDPSGKENALRQTLPVV